MFMSRMRGVQHPHCQHVSLTSVLSKPETTVIFKQGSLPSSDF